MMIVSGATDCLYRHGAAVEPFHNVFPCRENPLYHQNLETTA
jgi:hypothetical protein